jgi:hypothetical protein
MFYYLVMMQPSEHIIINLMTEMGMKIINMPQVLSIKNSQLPLLGHKKEKKNYQNTHSM